MLSPWVTLESRQLSNGLLHRQGKGADPGARQAKRILPPELEYLHSSLCLLQRLLKKLEKKKSHCLGQACRFYRHQVLSCRHTAPLRCSISRGYPMQVGLGLAPLGEQLVRNLWARTCLKVSQARAARCRGEMCQYFTFLWWMWLVRDFSVCASGFSSSVYNTSSAQQCMEIDLQASMRLFLWVRAT